MNFNFDIYLRIVKVLGDLRYTEDHIFWNEFVFQRIYKEPLTKDEATQLYDTLIGLKLKCPEINCEIPIKYVETLIVQFDTIENFDDLDPVVKSSIKHMGDVSISPVIKTKFNTTDNYKEILEKAQVEVESEERKKQQDLRASDPEVIRKKELRDKRKKRREERDGAAGTKDQVLYDSD